MANDDERKYGKKGAEWSTNLNDFVGEDELTVTITLHEYRDLVLKQGAEIKSVRDDLACAERKRDEWMAKAEKAEAALQRLLGTEGEDDGDGR